MPKSRRHPLPSFLGLVPGLLFILAAGCSGPTPAAPEASASPVLPAAEITATVEIAGPAATDTALPVDPTLEAAVALRRLEGALVMLEERQQALVARAAALAAETVAANHATMVDAFLGDLEVTVRHGETALEAMTAAGESATPEHREQLAGILTAAAEAAGRLAATDERIATLGARLQALREAVAGDKVEP